MPDKEFDQLFRNKFEDAEIEPSANLWANIEKELEPKRKRTLPIYWMAAASIAVAVTAMLVFQKKEVIQLHGQAPIAKVEQPIVPTNVEELIAVQPVTKDDASNEISAKVAHPVAKLSVESKVSATGPENFQVAVQPNANNDRLPIKYQDAKPIEVLSPIREENVETAVVTASVATDRNMSDAPADEIDNSSERKGIRNVGDLVNYVVDKVDKRDKKLVRFNTDDDDNSSIVGINIGFLKLNRKNKN